MFKYDMCGIEMMMLKIKLFLLSTFLLMKIVQSISFPPSMIKEPPHEQLYQVVEFPDKEDKPFMLECEANGDPEPEYRWIKNGIDFEYDDRIIQQPRSGTLVFTKSKDIDEGLYQCFATNSLGTSVSNAVFLRKSAKPYWIKSPDNKVAAEGDDEQFICDTYAVPEPKLQWLVNGEPLENTEFNPRRKLEGNVLTIENLEKSDTAVYQCNASNIYGYAFKNFYLNVIALPPEIIEGPAPLTRSLVTSNVTLICHAFGTPKPEIRWSKYDQELSGGRYQVLDSGDLQILDVQFYDGGMYACSASNRFGYAKASGYLEVKSKTVIVEPPEDVEVADGHSATFKCYAEADLMLEIVWLYNGQLLDFENNPRIVKSLDNSLTITRTVELDSGEFTCIARTELDQDEAQAVLIVQDVPHPPQIVRVSCTRLEALVVWKPAGDGRSPILSYSIQCSTSFTPDTWEDAYMNIAAVDTSFKIEMSPWVNYSFRVRAHNKIGPSEPSSSSDYCLTAPDVPYKNPDEVMGRGTTPNNLVISWKPMPPIEHNAPGFFYKVWWKQDDNSKSLWEVAELSDWQKNELIINDQPTFKRYQIKVEAFNVKGQPRESASEVFGHSGEDVPREAPLNFRLLHVRSPNSAVFAWDAVSPDSLCGHFRGYKIQTWIADESEKNIREVTVSPNVTETVIEIFRPNSKYIARICAFNDAYDGPSSNSIDFVTPEGTPGPVPYFDAIPLGAHAFYLIWKRPLEPNGNITGYRIYYQKVEGSDVGSMLERQPPITDPMATRAKLGSLRPNTRYRLTIHATTKAGKGDPYFTEVTTNEAAENVPDVPDFILSHLLGKEGKTSVHITWLPALNGNPGSYFYVQYRKKGEDLWVQTAVEENFEFIIVEGLEYSTPYEIRVVSVDGHYETPSRVVKVKIGELGFMENPAKVIQTCQALEMQMCHERNLHCHICHNLKGFDNL